MSLINDALKRAQEDKDRGGPPPLPMLSPMLGDEPEPQVAAAPKRASRIPLRVILLAAVVVAGIGWCAFHFRPRPNPALAEYTPSRPFQLTPQATTQPTVRATLQTTVQATAQATALPAVQATTLKIAAAQPAAAAITRPRVRVVAPPPGGLNLLPTASQPAALPPSLAVKAPTANEPDDLPSLPDYLKIPLPNMGDTPGPATDANDSSAAHPSAGPTALPAPGALPGRQGVKAAPDTPAATAAKTAPAAQPAAKPERSIAAAADVAQQFHVSCIMFSDQGSTAIINGSPVKVGATIRAEGVAKTGLPEEAVVKRIDRNCVEVDLAGERYLLRI